MRILACLKQVVTGRHGVDIAAGTMIYQCTICYIYSRLIRCELEFIVKFDHSLYNHDCMKTRNVICSIGLLMGMFFAYSVFAQDISGVWKGKLVTPVGSLTIVFHLNRVADGTHAYTTTMDSPDQGAYGLKGQNSVVDDSVWMVQFPKIQASYKGRLNPDGTIRGTFTQGVDMLLNVERGAAVSPNRPQEPVPPFPYKSEEVVVRNELAGINLAGTLTLPGKGKNFPAVVLVTGSGAQNRDEELMGHKPFLVLSDYLTRNGIAVLRCDDRGTAASEGDHTTATDEDFATDVAAAICYLRSRKEIDKQQIGIVGHSVGGTIAFISAAKDPLVAFVVSLAGVGVKGDSLLLRQVELISKSQGMADDTWQAMKPSIQKRYAILQQTEKTPEVLRKELYAEITKVIPSGQLKDLNTIQQISAQIASITSPWYLHFLRYDPATDLQRVKCPVLALNGERDIQVDAAMNLESIRRHLIGSGNKRVTVKAYPHLNHLFQTCKKGTLGEYAELEETISLEVLQDVTAWILRQVR